MIVDGNLKTKKKMNGVGRDFNKLATGRRQKIQPTIQCDCNIVSNCFCLLQGILPAREQVK
jgi:hypothetical protein